jgi:hypothetical protein
MLRNPGGSKATENDFMGQPVRRIHVHHRQLNAVPSRTEVAILPPRPDRSGAGGIRRRLGAKSFRRWEAEGKTGANMRYIGLVLEAAATD